MGSRETIADLNSDDDSRVLNAVYRIDESFADDQDVIRLLRRLALHGNRDIREISIMRLACRLGDGAIKDQLKSNIFGDEDELIFSASVRGLVCLSSSCKEDRDSLLSTLNMVLREINDTHRKQVVMHAIADISRSL